MLREAEATGCFERAFRLDKYGIQRVGANFAPSITFLTWCPGFMSRLHVPASIMHLEALHGITRVHGTTIREYRTQSYASRLQLPPLSNSVHFRDLC